MERDFLGLNSKESVITVKEETVEGCMDSAFSKGSGVPWPFSNKVSALPHFMSFKTGESASREIQKNANQDRQGGTHFSTTVFPLQHNAHSGHLPQDDKVLPLSSQTISVSMNYPSFKTHFAGAGQNFAGVTTKQQFLGGIPVTGPHSALPSLGSVAGITQPWFNSKVSGGPAQMTIFYAGTVNVYDDISPEKAEAIMFLAGNGSSITSNVAQSRAQVQSPISKLAAGDAVLMNHPMNAPPCSGHSSPMSVSSHPVGRSCSGSTTNNNEVMAAKITGVSTTPENKVEPPKIVTSVGPVASTTMIPSAVPQARKASLARFLEKRKERVMNSTPYNLSKKSPECATPGSNGVSFYASSGAVADSLAASHDA